MNTPINMINGLADETQYIYNSGVGSYLSSGTKNIGDAVSSELSYRINTPVSQQASDTWKAMKDPENWENATATAVLMLSPMKGGRVASTGQNVSAAASSVIKGGTNIDKGVFIVTREGVVLPQGAKIPEYFIENPYYKGASYGMIENGKFVEKLRIDQATPSGFKGPNQSHFHLNRGDHIFDSNKWPWLH